MIAKIFLRSISENNYFSCGLETSYEEPHLFAWSIEKEVLLIFSGFIVWWVWPILIWLKILLIFHLVVRVSLSFLGDSHTFAEVAKYILLHRLLLVLVQYRLGILRERFWILRNVDRGIKDDQCLVVCCEIRHLTILKFILIFYKLFMIIKNIWKLI